MKWLVISHMKSFKIYSDLLRQSCVCVFVLIYVQNATYLPRDIAGTWRRARTSPQLYKNVHHSANLRTTKRLQRVEYDQFSGAFAKFGKPTNSFPMCKSDCPSVVRYKHNIKARSCNHYCSRKAISIIYYKRESVVLAIQQAQRKRHIVTCGLSGLTTIFHIIS